MSRIDELLGIAPFDMGEEEKEGIFMEALRESLIFHYRNSEHFRKFCQKRGFDPSGEYRIEDIPFLPVDVFKTVKMISVSEEKASKNVLSSSTSGSAPSSIFLDSVTSRRQRTALNRIMSSFIGAERKMFVIFDSEKTVMPRDGKLSSRATAIRGMLPFMKESLYILDEKLKIDPGALRRASGFSKNPGSVCFLGFTYLFHQVMEENRNNPEVLELFRGFTKPYVLHLGGWKRLQNLNIDKGGFGRSLSSFLSTVQERVIDIYGMTEQLGTIYPDCRCGYKHVPLYSDIIIRDVQTLRPARDGEPGLIQLISPLPHSYPGISIISDDIGVIVRRDGCGCGRRGKTFVFRSRAEKAELKGCGDTLRDGA